MSLVTKKGQIITFENYRDFDRIKKKFKRKLFTFELDDIVEWYFLIAPFWPFKLLAHTMIEFTLKDGRNIVVSVEARRKPREKFWPLLWFFRRYWLIYLRGSHDDIVWLRTKKRKTDVYKYPLSFSKKELKNLLKYFIKRTQSLAKNPEYYNTSHKNCMTELRRWFKKLTYKARFLHMWTYFYGRLWRDLHKHGFIKTDQEYKKAKHNALLS